MHSHQINRSHHRRVKRRGRYFVPAAVTQAAIEAARYRRERAAKRAKP